MIEILKKKIQEAEAIIVGGASGLNILLQRKVQAFIHEQVLRAEVKDAK